MFVFILNTMNGEILPWSLVGVKGLINIYIKSLNCCFSL